MPTLPQIPGAMLCYEIYTTDFTGDWMWCFVSKEEFDNFADYAHNKRISYLLHDVQEFLDAIAKE